MTTAQVAGLLASLVLPALVGLLSKGSTPAWLKSLGLLLLTAAVTAATSIASGADVKSALTTGALAYATAVASHLGLLKPSGVTAAVEVKGIKDAPGSDGHDTIVPDDYEYDGEVLEGEQDELPKE